MTSTNPFDTAYPSQPEMTEGMTKRELMATHICAAITNKSAASLTHRSHGGGPAGRRPDRGPEQAPIHVVHGAALAMPMFRKKPVKKSIRPASSPAATGCWRLLELVRDRRGRCGGLVHTRSSGVRPHMTIPTLEGVMLAGEGDWIIKGVKGEFYPCKPDIFTATYEEVT